MEDSRDEGSLYEGTIIGCKRPDPTTGLMPWAPLQVEWDGGEGDVIDFVNPWAIEVLPKEGGVVDPNSRIEYPPFRELYKHHHSLLERPPATGSGGTGVGRGAGRK